MFFQSLRLGNMTYLLMTSQTALLFPVDPGFRRMHNINNAEKLFDCIASINKTGKMP